MHPRSLRYMRNPLDKMIIRNALHESLQQYPDRLKEHASPIGGSFGLVRSSGLKPHQGWDLYAPMWAQVYAISEATVVGVKSSLAPEGCQQNSYGNFVTIQLDLTKPGLERVSGKYFQLFAFYGHLAAVNVKVGDLVAEGAVVGRVGRSGNACHSPSHLHFEVRTVASPPSQSGLHYRIDPGELLGYDKYSSMPEA